MKHKLIFSAFIIMIFPIIVSAQVASGGSYSLEKTVVAGGGGNSSGGTYSLTGTSAQHLAGANKDAPPYTGKSGFWTPEIMAPTAATVSVAGRILTSAGMGIRNVVVTITNMSGQSRTTISSSFGYYRFNDIEVGDIYIITVSSKRFRFSLQTRVVAVNEELFELDFIANE